MCALWLSYVGCVRTITIAGSIVIYRACRDGRSSPSDSVWFIPGSYGDAE